MLLKTTEFRWFWRTDDQQRATAWFTALDGHSPTEEPSRQDRYLLLPGCRTTGVKLREGRFELKALLAERDECSMAGWPTGRLQTWVKWSLDRAVLAENERKLLDAGRWRQVGKTRLLRRYLPDQEDRLRPVAGDEEGQTCQAELTRISLPGQGSNWMTLGFEMNCDDQPDQAIAHVKAVVQHVCGDGWEDLGERTNLLAASYPGWLATLES